VIRCVISTDNFIKSTRGRLILYQKTNKRVTDHNFYNNYKLIIRVVIMNFIEPEKDHKDSIQKILLQHLSGGKAEDTHIPIKNVLSDEPPLSRIAIDDSNKVLGLMSAYQYVDIEKMIKERVSGMTKPSSSSIKEERVTFLAYAYVHKDHINQGIGTELLNNLLKISREEYDSEAAFAESWIYDSNLDSRSILRSNGFRVFFWPKNYWEPSEFCSYHKKKDCNCEGAIFYKKL
jgi:GNAT superfamily N-acetyltransferase